MITDEQQVIAQEEGRACNATIAGPSELCFGTHHLNFAKSRLHAFTNAPNEL